MCQKMSHYVQCNTQKEWEHSQQMESSTAWVSAYMVRLSLTCGEFVRHYFYLYICLRCTLYDYTISERLLLHFQSHCQSGMKNILDSVKLHLYDLTVSILRRSNITNTYRFNWQLRFVRLIVTWPTLHRKDCLFKRRPVSPPIFRTFWFLSRCCLFLWLSCIW